MKDSGWINRAVWTGTLAVLLSFGLRSMEGAVRRQTIELKTGWNAVFLQVQPVESRLSEVFRELPVESAACFIPASLQEQYLRAPGDAPWKEEGWAIWHAPARPEAFLSDLYELQSHRAYLVRASRDFTWKVQGTPSARQIQWYPNTCTLTGLPVESEAPPTFKEFFRGSGAHQRHRIFRLNEGKWTLVTNPGNDRPRNGEAYWIQTDGASTYQGPLRLTMSSSGDIDFDRLGSEKALVFSNESVTPCQIRLETISGTLPLQVIEEDLARRSTTYRGLPLALDLPSLAAGKTVKLRLAIDRSMLAASGSTLLRISDGRGTEQWVPLSARPALAAAK